jgi:hypothetical protein
VGRRRYRKRRQGEEREREMKKRKDREKERKVEQEKAKQIEVCQFQHTTSSSKVVKYVIFPRLNLSHPPSHRLGRLRTLPHLHKVEVKFFLH